MRFAQRKPPAPAGQLELAAEAGEQSRQAMQGMRSDLSTLQTEISGLDAALDAAPGTAPSAEPAQAGSESKDKERAQRARLQELLRQKRALCAHLDKAREEVQSHSC